MRSTLATAVIAAATVLLTTPAFAQAERSVTGVGQTKPPSRDAAPPATSAPLDAPPAGGIDGANKTEEQKRAELVEAIRKGQEAQRARDRAADELMARWEFAVCVGCGPSLKPFRRVWTNPLRVLAGIPATDDDKRNGRMRTRWTTLVMR